MLGSTACVASSMITASKCVLLFTKRSEPLTARVAPTITAWSRIVCFARTSRSSPFQAAEEVSCCSFCAIETPSTALLIASSRPARTIGGLKLRPSPSRMPSFRIRSITSSSAALEGAQISTRRGRSVMRRSLVSMSFGGGGPAGSPFAWRSSLASMPLPTSHGHARFRSRRASGSEPTRSSFSRHSACRATSWDRGLEPSSTPSRPRMVCVLPVPGGPWIRVTGRAKSPASAASTWLRFSRRFSASSSGLGTNRWRWAAAPGPPPRPPRPCRMLSLYGNVMSPLAARHSRVRVLMLDSRVMQTVPCSTTARFIRAMKLRSPFPFPFPPSRPPSSSGSASSFSMSRVRWPPRSDSTVASAWVSSSTRSPPLALRATWGCRVVTNTMSSSFVRSSRSARAV